MRELFGGVTRVEEILRRLPGHNCGACGHARCDEFAAALQARREPLSACAVLLQERYRRDRVLLEAALAGDAAPPAGDSPDAAAERGSAGACAARATAVKAPVGLIDGYEADFTLAPLRGEPSCREMLLPLTPPASGAGEVIRYRPLGCPITHFARLIEKREGLLVVHIVGPRHRLGDSDFHFTDIGLCMVIGFEGRVEGALPAVGQTVRFMPAECMMGKVHSAVVVACEGRTVRLEGVDLKVWAPPVRPPAAAPPGRP